MAVSQLWGASPAASTPASQRQDRTRATPVIVAQTGMIQDDRSLSAIGTGFASRSITLRAPTSGKIIEFNIAPGRSFEGQIGISVLIGVMAKNGILLVECANQLHDQGSSVLDAAMEAHKPVYSPYR